jgi:chemotaxis protein MotB
MAEQQPEIKIKFVKKKGGHAAAHGGAWKVAYADLVTALMSFFLLMWLLNSANANTKAGLAGYFQEGMKFFQTEKGQSILIAHGKGILPGGRGMSPTPGEGQGGSATEPSEEAQEKEQEAMEKTANAIEEAFSSDQLLQAFKDQISLDFTDEGLRIQVQDKAAQVLFDSGSAQLKPYTLAILKEIAGELGKLPNRVVIGGHTDSFAFSAGGRTNWELSAERANSARRVLEASGLQKGQVQRVTGYSDTIPLGGKDPKAPQNRRISIVVLSSTTQKAEEEHQKTKPARGKEGKGRK